MLGNTLVGHSPALVMISDGIWLSCIADSGRRPIMYLVQGDISWKVNQFDNQSARRAHAIVAEDDDKEGGGNGKTAAAVVVVVVDDDPANNQR